MRTRKYCCIVLLDWLQVNRDIYEWIHKFRLLAWFIFYKGSKNINNIFWPVMRYYANNSNSNNKTIGWPAPCCISFHHKSGGKEEKEKVAFKHDMRSTIEKPRLPSFFTIIFDQFQAKPSLSFPTNYMDKMSQLQAMKGKCEENLAKYIILHCIIFNNEIFVPGIVM